MAKQIEISFNSPQCGWMSIGFDDGEREYRTTTAHAPHTAALQELMQALTRFAAGAAAKDAAVVAWSRNPEAYDIILNRDGAEASLAIIEYPTFDRAEAEAETVFSWRGDAGSLCRAFYATFAQLHEDRVTDEFDFNWHQPFPYAEFEAFGAVLAGDPAQA